MTKQNKQFAFEISLSVLDHLGRNLYRSFITVLGEAISNSWDADAKNVWITVDKENNLLIIKDDGTGMTADDFQNKFLKIGYSKRKDGSLTTKGGRPYIGRKGIGKLALLSCAKKISVTSKTQESGYIGGVIDNNDLDQAITADLTPQEYLLESVEDDKLEQYKKDHIQGTIIYFENINDGIKNSVQYLKKLIALYFRFSLVDDSFNIFVNGDLVTLDDLKELAEATEFLWTINVLEDPYIARLSKLKSEPITMSDPLQIRGFIATVVKPRQLKISGTEEKISIDLLVNGRLRERDILKHLPDFSTRHIASYLYGQIHFDELDQGGKDRFTSSREGIVQDDDKYSELIKTLKENILGEISTKWDELRLERGEDGDDENPRKSLKQRRALSLYNLSSTDYTGDRNDEINKWVKELQPDAEFNIPAYVDCFLSENLVRRYIEEKKLPLSDEAKDEIKTFKGKETKSKGDGNISIDIRKSASDLSYLDMDNLANLVDKVDRTRSAGLSRDAYEYKPIRDALAHTALLTDAAKNKLTTVYENIKARVRELVSVK